MIRRRKKNKTVEGELSLFSQEHWESLDNSDEGGLATATPHHADQTIEPIETIASIEQTDAAGSISATSIEEVGINPLLEDMKWAIRYVRMLDIDSTRMIAMETSMIVQSEYHTDHLYIINTLHGERMNGQKVATLCYASFMRAFPSMIEHLSLNFYDLYQAALADD